MSWLSCLGEWLVQRREIGAQKAFRRELDAAVRAIPQGEWRVLSALGAPKVKVIERTYQAATSGGAPVRLVFRDETGPDRGRSYMLYVDGKASGSFSNNPMLCCGGDRWLEGLAQGIDDHLASECRRLERASATSEEREYAAQEREAVSSKL